MSKSIPSLQGGVDIYNKIVKTAIGDSGKAKELPITKEFIKEDAPPNSDNLPVRLILCFDGTGDTASGSFSAAKGKKSGTQDSIWTIFDLAKGGPVTDNKGKQMYQYPQYFEGVATINSDKGGLAVQAKALFDGATGHGYLDILRNGYKVCCQQLQHSSGDSPHELFIYGFSRGAFIARSLASFLQHVGIIREDCLDKDPKQDKEFQARFRELLQRYMKVTKSNKAMEKHPNQLLDFCISAPRVRVLGAFDTVKTVIPLPVQNYLSGGIVSLDFQMDAPGLVDHFRHALALNEARPLFNPDLWKSDSENTDTSYLEAWFFGYHHDIGGGDDIQGLALWPLQWILHASTDNGLVLDPDIELYDILFSGTDSVVETPHEIALKMYDMIRHHAKSHSTWGLKLNQPFSLMAPRPREFFQFITKPPYIKFVKPKVFVHPSAYLVFDICSSFRIQVYEWKHFQRFLNDRSLALSENKVPWWEKQTINSIVNEESGLECFNLLVLGRPKTGKSEMITKVFGKPIGPLDKGINHAVLVEDNDLVRMYFSAGFGKGGTDGRLEVSSFLERHRNNPDVASRIHAIWYFHDCSHSKVEESEKSLFGMDFGDIPVLVILQNEDKLCDQIKEDQDVEEQGYTTEVKTNILFAEALDSIQQQLTLPKFGKYVETRNNANAAKSLITETASSVQHDSIRIAQIKAERVEVLPKIALATEESIRAYAIWYMFKSAGEVHRFSRNKDPTGMSLADILIEPIVTTFNMARRKDAEVIKPRISAPWKSLDNFTKGLRDPEVPGDLILICMLDIIIIMTHAVTHPTRPKNWKGEAFQISTGDMERACTWFATPPKAGQPSIQDKMHQRVKDLLDAQGYPRSGSIASLQMKVIEIVDSFTRDAQNAPSTIIGAAAAAATGAIKGAFSGVSSGVSGVTSRFWK